ncbi:MAG: AtpZ/AtpI family protein [Flavobacteriales bacterium]
MTKKHNSTNSYLKLSSAAIQMAAVICLFTWIGTLLDKKFHSDPLFTIVLALLGVALGMYLIIKEVNALNREN